MRFFCINDGVPEVTINSLRGACDKREVDFVEIYAPAFLFDPESQLVPGDMLYSPAISAAASRVEQFLFADKVATFYADPRRVLFATSHQRLVFQRSGLPTPRAIPVLSADRNILRAHVQAVGGFPVIVKIPGWSAGVGTIKVDSFPTLFSLLDFILAVGHSPLICAFIGSATYWRLTVVGNRVVASHRGEAKPDDFRVHGSSNRADFIVRPPEAAITLAIRAVEAMDLEFGGVDLLEHSSGRFFLLESNFPCFFAGPQLVTGVDVAGSMIDHLIAKSRRLTAPNLASTDHAN
jgi:biotin carboxylase